MSFRGKIHIMTIKSDVYIPFQAQIKDYFNCLKILRKKLPQKNAKTMGGGWNNLSPAACRFLMFLDFGPLSTEKTKKTKGEKNERRFVLTKSSF